MQLSSALARWPGLVRGPPTGAGPARAVQRAWRAFVPPHTERAPACARLRGSVRACRDGPLPPSTLAPSHRQAPRCLPRDAERAGAQRGHAAGETCSVICGLVFLLFPPLAVGGTGYLGVCFYFLPGIGDFPRGVALRRRRLLAWQRSRGVGYCAAGTDGIHCHKNGLLFLFVSLFVFFAEGRDIFFLTSCHEGKRKKQIFLATRVQVLPGLCKLHFAFGSLRFFL